MDTIEVERITVLDPTAEVLLKAPSLFPELYETSLLTPSRLPFILGPRQFLHFRLPLPLSEAWKLTTPACLFRLGHTAFAHLTYLLQQHLYLGNPIR